MIVRLVREHYNIEGSDDDGSFQKQAWSFIFILRSFSLRLFSTLIFLSVRLCVYRVMHG